VTSLLLYMCCCNSLPPLHPGCMYRVTAKVRLGSSQICQVNRIILSVHHLITIWEVQSCLRAPCMYTVYVCQDLRRLEQTILVISDLYSLVWIGEALCGRTSVCLTAVCLAISSPRHPYNLA